MYNHIGPPGAAISGLKWRWLKSQLENTVEHEADKNKATETLSIDLKYVLKNRKWKIAFYLFMVWIYFYF